MRIFASLAFIFLLNILAAQNSGLTDSLSPLDVVKNYVSPNGFPGKQNHFCCEMQNERFADSSLGQQLPKRVRRDCRLIFADSTHAAVSAWLHDSATSMDVYFFLHKNAYWTIHAVRKLVMTDAAKREIQRLDSIPHSQRKKRYTQTHAHSFSFDHDNAVLWGSPDTTLAKYFHTHKKDFTKLLGVLQKNNIYSPSDTSATNATTNLSVKKLADKLLIREIDCDKNHPGTLRFIIGGISDNTVGFLYQPDPKNLPHCTEKHYILIRQLDKGWYLFKTT